MEQEKNSNIETPKLKNSYVEDIAGNLVDCNENNEKDIISSGAVRDFKEEDLQEFIENFSHYADDNNIDYEKFDFNEYTEDYYAKKFPGFEPWVHKILAECSKKKIEDHRKKVNGITIEKNDATISFN